MSSRHRSVAGVAALVALTASLVLAGGLAAHADGGLEFTSPLDGASLTASNSPTTISGVAPDQTELRVENWSIGSPDPICVVTPAADLTWSCDTSLTPGAKELRVFQQVGTFSDVVLFDVEVPTPTVSGPPDAWASGTISLTGGAGYLGATITAVVTTPNEPSLTCTATIEGDGSWHSCDIPFDAELAPGTTATVTVTQTFGALSASTTHDVEILELPPFAVTSPTPSGGVTWAPGAFQVAGTNDDGQGITAQIDGGPGCLAMQSDMAWTCGFAAAPDPGTHTLSVQRGVETPIVFDFDVRLPAPDADTDEYEFEQSADMVFTGTQTYPGTTTRAVVYQDAEGSPFEEAMPPVDCPASVGSWTCTIPASLSAGSYFVAFEHVLTADPTVPAEQSTAFPLRIVADPGAGASPRLACEFRPNGGVRSTSDVTLDRMEIYRIAPGSSGSGDSGVDSGGGGSAGGVGALAPEGTCNDRPGLSYPSEYTYDLVTSCGQACDVSSLPAGDYEIWHVVADSVPGYDYSGHSYKFRVPEAPTISTVASVGRSVIARGVGTAGDTVRVERSSGATLCTTTVASNGRWACTFGPSGATRARVLQIDAASGGMSAYSPYRALPVAPTPAVDPPLEIVQWILHFGGDFMNLKPGDVFTINVSGMPEGTDIEVWIHSTPRLLGTGTGTGLPMSMDLTVPADMENGPHEIRMIGTTPLGTQYFFTSDAMVVGGVDPVVEVDEPGDGEPSSGPGGAVDRSDPAAPSALSESLPTLDRIVTHPVTVLVAGGLALALLFLVALPTELLNSSLSSNASRLGRAYGAIDGAMSRAQDWLIRVTRSRAVAAIVVVLLISVIYGFVDPGFGPDIVSARLVLSLALAFFVLTFGASWISGLIIRRAWGTSGVVTIQPSIILFAIVGVIVARILDFSPGFLVGVAIGLELLAASKRVSGRAVFVQLSVVTGLALAAWVVYSLFTPGDDFAGMLAQETMVAITAEGLTGALIAIFPLRFLDGRELWEVSKRLWAIAFVVVATAFALLVLPTAVEGTEVADYGVWLLVFAVFGGVSIAVWFVFSRAAQREEAAEAEKVDA